MKKIIFPAVLFIFLLTPALKANAQSLSATEPTVVTFDTTGLPGWVNDLRRWEIVAFGTFPFSLFAVTFITDMFRWNSANGMNFSSEGRRYAPWPFKSAGGADISNSDFQKSVLLAAGLSLTLAFVDLFITMTKRSNERQRLESAPSGSVTIERTPPEDDPEDNGIFENN
ncbi:MAG: hypothetical protein LBG94_09205 [Treponema sp.]|jgi:hypothetical protein|nr:hypothetical protein [Treponema sp.]